MPDLPLVVSAPLAASLNGPAATRLERVGISEISVVAPSFVQGIGIVAVIVMLATAVLLWARIRPGRRRFPRASLLGALLAVVLTQVLVVGAVSARANAHLGFVRTIGDVLAQVRGSGSFAGGPAVLSLPEEPTSIPTSQPSPMPADAAAFTPIKGGSDYTGFSKATVTGRRSGVTQEVWAWTPRGYSPNDGRTYPVLMMLHGDPGSPDGVTTALKVASAMQAAIDSGKMPPAILVMPNLSADSRQTAMPDCADVVGHAQVGTWVQDDIPAVVRASFPNVSPDRSGWAIGGVSSGAFCATWTAIMRSDAFGYVVAMSGFDVPFTGAMSTNRELKSANTLSTLLRTRAHQRLRMWQMAAKDDTGTADLRRDLPSAVPSTDTLEMVTPQTGGHSATLWRQTFPTALSWWGEQLKSPVAADAPLSEPTAEEPSSARQTHGLSGGESATGAGDGADTGAWGSFREVFTGIRGIGVIILMCIVALALSVAAIAPWRGGSFPGPLRRLRGLGGLLPGRARSAEPSAEADEPASVDEPAETAEANEPAEAESADKPAEAAAERPEPRGARESRDSLEAPEDAEGSAPVASPDPGRLKKARALLRGARPVGARLVVLALACVAGTLAIALVSNRIGGFFPTWSIAIQDLALALA
ncbi:alpha/beta hydrolase [Actinomyces sp. zg328]|uniref:alpha/beta hydrolase n=1 Tax=Actinomyces sp. zg328 TaxID=2609287 RepID=UPI001357CC48|nr:alpha/beta hydrolase-fold protein [Actinomyces sp. zg328]